MTIANNGRLYYLVSALLLGVLIVERVESTFFKQTQPTGRKYYPWLTYIPFTTYLFIVVTILCKDFLFRRSFNLICTVVGLSLYGFGIFLRRASQKGLGDQWSIHIEIKPNHRIIRSGIYRYLRHPYSMAVISELLGLSVLFKSWFGVALTILVQLPLLLARNRAEEKVLGEHLFKPRVPKSTIFDILKQFSLGQIFEFFAINRAMKHYNRYYMLTNCMTALLNVGLFSCLGKNGSVDVRKYAHVNGLDFNVLNTICGYLMSQGIIGKRGKRITITRKGKFLVDSCRGIFNFVTAYQPVFSNLEALLRTEKQYGRDIVRDGKYVAMATADLAKRFTFPIVKSVIAEHGFKSVLDAGCGSGEFLESLLEINGVTLCGVDISKEALDYGKDKFISGEIKLELCDLFNLSQLKETATVIGKDPEVVTFIFVLHEFVGKGLSKLVHYLRSLRLTFPESRLLIYELFLHKWHKLRRISSAIREHHLFHYLSNQGLLSVGNWHNVIYDSGYHIEEQKVFKDFGQGYFLLKP